MGKRAKSDYLKNNAERNCLGISAFMNIIRPTIYLLILMAFAPLSFSQLISPPHNTPDASQTPANLTQLRHHYQLAKRHLVKDQLSDFRKHQTLAKDYVLSPYLEYAYLKAKMNTLPEKAVAAFLKNHSDSYLSVRLRSQFLHALSKRRKWATYIVYYSPSLRSKSLECSYIYAQVKTGNKNALNKVADIWVSHKSLPKMCDPLFKVWRDEKLLTDEIAWSRYVLAMENNKISLARYVKSLMSEEYQKYATLFHKVYGYPSTIRNKKLYTRQSKPMRDIISYGIRRYARHNVSDAAKQWVGFESNQLFDSQTVIKTKAALIKQFVKKGDIALAEKWIESSNELRTSSVLQPLIHHALKNLEWKKVLTYVNLLNNQEQSKERWQYWRARAMSALNQTEMQNLAAIDIFQKLAQSRSFYGFLSADIIGQNYNLQHKTSQSDAQLTASVLKVASIQRAKELWLTDRISEAQAEWQHTMKQLSPEQIIEAGSLARSWGQHNQAIRTMIYGKQWDMLDIRFPLAFKDEIDMVATDMSMPPTLIFAVARQESAFLENARSRAGARGLMQLMPATAKETAHKGGIKHKTKDLYDPAHNILLGSYYLKELLDKYDNNTALATAAYNAGPHRVDTWLKDRPSTLPTDIWVETIPFRETRGYVKNVLAYTVIYAYRLGDKELKLQTKVETKKAL